MLDANDILRMVKDGEGRNVDFKRSVPSKVRELSEEVCGFANSSGGYVLIGVSDGNQIIGAEIDNSKRSAIQDSIGEISPKLRYDIYPVYVDGKTVWVIEVPSSKNKPHFVAGAAYIREGASCQKITSAEEIRALFEQNNKVYFDAIPFPKISLDKELDENNFNEFKKESGISNAISNQQILENLQIYDEDGWVKRGGVLFFAREPERYLPYAVIRCVLFKGNEKVYILDDKVFGGPLPQQYKKAIEWLKGKLQISYEIEGVGPRKEIWEVPLGVFKESIINALSHRDYYEQGATITIEMFDDRIEISNPGELLPAVAQNFGHRSISRNPLIFGLFNRMHLVEHIGSGIPRMIKDMIDAGLPEPKFDTKGMFAVTINRPLKQSKNQKLSQLTEIQRSILQLIGDNPSLTMEQIGNHIGFGRTKTYQNIKTLREKGLLKRQGRKSDGIWIVNL